MATEELTLPGFRHDTLSAVYPAAAASPVFARWPLERHGLRWSHPRSCYAHPLPGGRALVGRVAAAEVAGQERVPARRPRRPGPRRRAPRVARESRLRGAQRRA